MPEKHLSHTQVRGLAIDMADAGTSKRMRTVEGRVEMSESDPVFHQTPVAIHAEALSHRSVLRGEEGITVGFILGLDQLLQRHTGIIPHGEADTLARLSLVERDTLLDLSSLKHVGDVQGDDIRASEAGIDGHGKHGDVPHVANLREQGANGRDLLGRQGRFSPDDLSLVPRFW